MDIRTAAKRAYHAWLEDPLIDDETKQELRSIENQPGEIEDRFYKDLEFGTGGLRGVIGAGTNRMNVYTVGKATQGLAQSIKRNAAQDSVPSVVIAHDSRRMSPEFALEAACVLAGNGIRAYVFEELRPTPELSFAVRHLRADAGIVITASHNPPEYNGYKVYDSDGGQLVPDKAEVVIREVRSVTEWGQIQRKSREQAEREKLLVWIGEEVDRAYIEAVTAVSLRPEAIRDVRDRFRIVYTPLHGTGNEPVRKALEAVGFSQVHVVEAQEKPDPDFSTVRSPNPEEREAFELALKKAEETHADIVIGTDPDCDRVGAMVRTSSGGYEALNGNQAGALMLHYLLETRKARGTLPDNGAVIKTIVTGELGARIAADYGMTVMNTLTGFKYIGEKISEFDQTKSHTFLFGYEESYGYLAGTHCRDKDAVVASVLICEAAAWYSMQGKTLLDVLSDLYSKYGVHLEKLHSRTMKGAEGMQRIRSVMETWRQSPPAALAGVEVEEVLDYANGRDGLPPANVLKYVLEDGSWFCLRPSGTEPKIKIYMAVRASAMDEAREKMERLSAEVLSKVD